MRALLTLPLFACDTPPEACVSMCAAAAEGLGPCVEEEGLGWEAYGYRDAADFRDACETWAWEQDQMAREAARREGGGVAGLDRLAARCEELETTFTVGTCEERQSVDWTAPAWK